MLRSNCESSWAWYLKNTNAPARFAAKARVMHKILVNKYYVDEIYDIAIVQTVIGIGDALWKSFDVQVIDGIVNGIAKLLQWIASGVRRIQTGLVSNYALMMAIGIILVVGYMVWKI